MAYVALWVVHHKEKVLFLVRKAFCVVHPVLREGVGIRKVVVCLLLWDYQKERVGLESKSFL